MTECAHSWEYFIADEGKGAFGGTPYYFCRKCKHSIAVGRGIVGFKDCKDKGCWCVGDG